MLRLGNIKHRLRKKPLHCSNTFFDIVIKSNSLELSSAIENAFAILNKLNGVKNIEP